MTLRFAKYRRRLTACCLAAALCAGWACASGGVQEAAQQVWREDMGRIPLAALQSGMRRVFRKHDIYLAREDTSAPRTFLYETRWEQRDALAIEQAGGVTAARNRIVITGQRLESTGFGGGNVFRVTWEVENEVSAVGQEGWHPEVIHPETIEAFRRIFSDLELEVRTGVRGS